MENLYHLQLLLERSEKLNNKKLVLNIFDSNDNFTDNGLTNFGKALEKLTSLHKISLSCSWYLLLKKNFFYYFHY